MSRASIMWFRRDLRLTDHPALAAAAAQGPVVGLFVVDPAFPAGSVRAEALAAALASLDQSMGATLVVRHGDPVAVVAAVAAEARATEVFVTRDAAPYGRRRDAAVATALTSAGARLRGIGWNYAVPPGTLRTGAATPYAVFSPFARKWRTIPLDAQVPSGPIEWRALAGERVPTAGQRWSLGEGQAVARWEAFRAERLERYPIDRDRPGVDGTSRLSAALRWGTIHPRRLLAELGPDDERFSSELIWREFYADVLANQPESAWSNLDRRLDAMPVDTGPDAVAAFDRWRNGTTGFPIIDAGMRQLAATGWMHNRVRMLVASFLVKDLHLPWQWGARHFLRLLVDGDVASNNHGWQWAAGTGTDAAPYFRIFNPTTQSERFDPDGRYLRQWVPQLAGLGDREIHAPGTHRPDGYPAPMVDHAAERLEALARYRSISTR